MARSENDRRKDHLEIMMIDQMIERRKILIEIRNLQDLGARQNAGNLFEF